MKNNTNYYYNQLNQNFSPKIYSKTNPYSFYNPNNQSQSSNNKISYNPNIMSNQNQNFIPPNQKNPIKWRNINKINLPYLKNNRDISLLGSQLDNLINGQINEDDIQAIQENSIVKLIQILQTTSDILLNEQAELENKKLELESKNIEKMKKFQKNDRVFNKHKEEIHRLKKAKNRDIGVINTYLNVLNNLKQGNFSQESYNITDIEINKKNINDKNTNINSQKEKEGEEFKCQICPDKKFSTEFELTKHLEEVHNLRKNYPIYQGQNMPQSQLQILKPEVIVKVPDNFYGMNNINRSNDINSQEILSEMKNMQQQFYQKMEEEKLMQEKLNQNQREMQQNYLNNDLSKLEKTFRDTIDNFKSMMQQKNNQPTNVFIEESEDDEEDPKKLEELRILKEQLENLKANNNKKKFEYETEEKKYESIVLEINQTKKFNEDNYANNNLMNNNYNTSFNTNMQITNGPKLFDFTKKKVKKKPYFNSGKIQPDYDDLEEEYEKKKEAIDYLENNKELIINTIRQNQFLTNIKPEEETKKIDNDDNNVINIGTVTPIINPKKTQLSSNLDTKPIFRQKKINKELDNYYKRYNKRDKQFLKNNKFPDYLVETLPENYQDDENIDMNELIEEKTKKIASEIFPKNMNLNFEFDEEQLKEENINNLYNLANNLMNDIEEKNSKNQFSNEHYQSIMKTLGFKNIKLTANKIKEKREDEIIVKKKDEENKINTVINSLIDTKIKKEENNINNNINTQINNKIEKKEDKKEETGGLIMTDFIIDETNKKEEDNLKKIPKEKNMNNANTSNFINNENQITDFLPKITLKEDKKDQEVIVQTTTIKEPITNNLNSAYTSTQINNIQDTNKNINNLDVAYTSTQINNMQDSNKNVNNLDVPYTSTQANVQDINKNVNNLDVPYTSTQANAQDINKNANNLDVPYTSTQANAQNINKNVNNLDVPYTSTQANAQDINKNINNLDVPYTSTQAKAKEEPNLQNINNNNLDVPYNSGMASGQQNQNPNINMINNVNNLDVAYNSVKGPIFNNNIIAEQEKNKIPNMPYTSTMANNNIPNPNTQINQGNTGISEQQGINPGQNNQEIKPEITESSKIKESEMMLEKNPNDVTNVQNNNNVNNANNNNNDTTVVKNSVIDPNDKSMEFDKQVLQGFIKKNE